MDNYIYQKPSKRPVGRPKKNEELVKTESFRVRMTEKEKKSFQAMCHKSGLSGADLLAEALSFYAKKKLGYEGYRGDSTGYWEEYWEQNCSKN